MKALRALCQPLGYGAIEPEFWREHLGFAPKNHFFAMTERATKEEWNAYASFDALHAEGSRTRWHEGTEKSIEQYQIPLNHSGEVKRVVLTKQHGNK